MNTIFRLTTRDPCSSRERYSARNLLGYAAIIGIALFGVRMQAATIEFNDPFPAPYSFVPDPGAGSDVFYSEDGMTFIAVNHSHYHFSPEDPSLFDENGELYIAS